MRSPSVPRLVLYGLTAVIALAVLVAVTTTTAAFGAYNPAWDGTSDLRDQVATDPNGTVALETTAYEAVSPDETVAIVIAPTEPYTEADTERLRAFLGAGGTLVVAEDYGPHGNALLDAVGATARFDGDQLRDETYYYRAPTLPVATSVSPTPYTTGVEQLTLNGGTAVVPGDARPIVNTSTIAYLDRNRTGTLSPEDELRQHPVVTVERVGGGRVVAVGDPSLFINAMMSEPDNEAFVDALVNTGEHVVLDYSRAGAQPVLAVGLLRLRTTPLAQVIIGLMAASLAWSVLGYWPTSRGLARRTRRLVFPQAVTTQLPAWLSDGIAMNEEPQIDAEQIHAALTQQYPELDPDQLARVMRDVLSTDPKEQRDE